MQIYLEEDGNGFKLINIGNGVAVNVSIAITFLEEDFAMNLEAGTETDFLHVLKPGQEQKVLKGLAIWISPENYRNANSTFIFADIEGNYYEQSNKMMGNVPQHGYVKPLPKKETE